MVDWDREVHVLHSVLSVLVVPYDIERRLMAFRGEFPSEDIPLLSDILVASLVV